MKNIIILSIFVCLLFIVGCTPEIVNKRSSASYWRTAELTITKYQFTQEGSNIFVRNNLQNTVIVNKFSLLIDGKEIDMISENIVLGPGTEKELSSEFICNGDQLNATVNAIYVNDETGEEITFTGDGNILEITCIN